MTTPTFVETVGLLAPFTYGRGYPDYAYPANPAAGATFTQKVPGNREFRIVAARFSLATSAQVANRAPSLIVQDGDGNEMARIESQGSIAASSTAVVTFARGLGSAYGGGAGAQVVGLPDLFLPPLFSIVLGATALQTSDQLSGIRLWWESFPIGNQGYPEQLLPAPAPYPT